MSTVDLHHPSSHRHSSEYTHPQSFRPEVLTRNSTSMTSLSWWTMFSASMVAFVVSGYLVWSSITSSPVAGCGGGSVFDCSHVLHTKWSTVLSIPVSVPAIATHFILIALLLEQPTTKRFRRLRWQAIGFASLAAGAAAIWFISLQVFVIRHLCPYCLVAHAAGLIVAGVFLMNRPVSTTALRWISSSAVVAVLGLVSLQVASEAPPTYEVIQYSNTPNSNTPNSFSPNAAESSTGLSDDTELFAPPASANLQTSFNQTVERWQSVNWLGMVATVVNPASSLFAQVDATSAIRSKTAEILGGVSLETDAWPLIGKPDAELVFVEMFDYTCPHCQRTHESLNVAKQSYGDRLAVITLPVPIDQACNATVRTTQPSNSESCELAKLAIAVWTIDRARFAEFHNYMFQSKPTYAQALGHAKTLVEPSVLDTALRSTVPSDYIKRHVALYQKAGAGQIPKLLFPRTTTVGAVESPDEMIRLIQQNLGR